MKYFRTAVIVFMKLDWSGSAWRSKLKFSEAELIYSNASLALLNRS